MKHFKKIGSVLVCVILILTMFVGCTEAGRVKHNVKQDADNFNVTRRVTVINSRSDKVIIELIGNCSIQVDSEDKQLEVTSEIADGQYKIDYINLNEWTTYVVEDLSGADVSKYHYELNYLPEAVQPFTVTSKD